MQFFVIKEYHVSKVKVGGGEEVNASPLYHVTNCSMPFTFIPLFLHVLECLSQCRAISRSDNKYLQNAQSLSFSVSVVNQHHNLSET